ncbi:MAG TPA: caspase family protein [Candidatus Melainabacteria bacterium]|nr:caspase family protein [Candidatus Melainabacteria bacterium]
MRNGLRALVMAVFFAVLCPLSVLAAPPSSPPVVNTPVQDKWALVVGISQFANSQLNLKYAAKDAQDFRDFLVGKCNFAPDHVKLLQNEQATKDRILDVLGDSWLPRVSLPDDLVVIFISSHGSPSDLDVAGVNYVVAHDTNPDKLFTTGIPIQTLAQTIKDRVHSKRVLVILDACHSGGAAEASKGIRRVGNVDAAAVAQGAGSIVICSSSRNESSWEAKSKPNGVFTSALMESLKSGGSSTKLRDAFNTLKDKVQQQVVAERGVTQTPVLEATKWKGEDLILSAVPAAPRPAPKIDDEPPRAVRSSSSDASASHSANASEPGGNSTTAIPDITGDFAGTNGFTYHYWQKGRSCGWSMPLLGMTGSGLISSDGKKMESKWWGTVSGSCGADLEVDQDGKVVKMNCDNGTVLTRVNYGK